MRGVDWESKLTSGSRYLNRRDRQSFLGRAVS